MSLDPDDAGAADRPSDRRPTGRPGIGPMARIAIVFTGGTISMRLDPVAGGNVPVLGGAAILLETVPGSPRSPTSSRSTAG